MFGAPLPKYTAPDHGARGAVSTYLNDYIQFGNQLCGRKARSWYTAVACCYLDESFYRSISTTVTWIPTYATPPLRSVNYKILRRGTIEVPNFPAGFYASMWVQLRWSVHFSGHKRSMSSNGFSSNRMKSWEFVSFSWSANDVSCPTTLVSRIVMCALLDPNLISNNTDNVSITQQWGAFVQPLLQWKSNKYYIFWVCVCTLDCPACNANAPFAPSGLSGYTTFFHIIS